MRLFAFLLLLTLPASAAAQTALSDTLPPSFTKFDAKHPELYLNSWSNWDAHETEQFLRPSDQSIKSFGGLLPSETPTEKNIIVLHIVESEEVPTNPADLGKGSTIDLKQSNWFFFRYGAKEKAYHQILKRAKVKAGQRNPDLPDAGTLPDIYGVENGYLISVSRMHVYAGHLLEEPSTAPAAPSLSYTIVPTVKTAANIAAIQALLGGVTGVTFSSGLGVAPAAPVIRIYNYSFSIAQISNKALTPPYSVAFTATPASTIDGDSGDCHNITKKTSCTLTQTVSVNDVEHWNVGINIVAWGPRENKYDLTKDNALEQTHTRHSALYAVVDVSPWASVCPMNKCPYLQAGVPLSGATFHVPYVGMAQPLPFFKWLPISAYGGVAFMRQTHPKTLAIGATTDQTTLNNDLTTDWPVKALYGIEVPVSSIIKSVKSSIGSSK